MPATAKAAATRTRKPAKPRPSDTCRLTVHIRGVAYSAFPIEAPAHGPGRRDWRLCNVANGKVYDVAETPHGPTCDCGDFTFRREGIDPAGCKHVRALTAFGLIALAR